LKKHQKKIKFESKNNVQQEKSTYETGKMPKKMKLLEKKRKICLGFHWKRPGSSKKRR